MIKFVSDFRSGMLEEGSKFDCQINWYNRVIDVRMYVVNGTEVGLGKKDLALVFTGKNFGMGFEVEPLEAIWDGVNVCYDFELSTGGDGRWRKISDCIEEGEECVDSDLSIEYYRHFIA